MNKTISFEIHVFLTLFIFEEHFSPGSPACSFRGFLYICIWETIYAQVSSILHDPLYSRIHVSSARSYLNPDKVTKDITIAIRNADNKNLIHFLLYSNEPHRVKGEIVTYFFNFLSFIVSFSCKYFFTYICVGQCSVVICTCCIRAYSLWAFALAIAMSLINGSIDFYGVIHIEWCQTSKENIANANAIAHCEWTLNILLTWNNDFPSNRLHHICNHNSLHTSSSRNTWQCAGSPSRPARPISWT